VKHKKLISLCLLSAIVGAVEFSGNIGYASEYHYRGIFQHADSLNAGVDIEAGGFSAGVWTADVGDGAEVDLYGSYSWELGDLTASAGMTGYYYTGDFDETYEEVNLGLDYKFLSVAHSYGTWDGEEGMDYDFTSVTANWNGLYTTYGVFGKEFEGDYIQAGYGLEWAGFDWGVSYIKHDEGDSLIGTVSRSFNGSR
jgi:uncharacterized protein (TIGR02001 family)